MNLREFSRKNRERCELAFHPLEDWSLTDWATAMAGEAGEAFNVIKKLRRGDFGADCEAGPEYAKREAAMEIADAVTYADLLCQRLGFDLSEVLAAKFNHVSRRVGSEITINSGGESGDDEST